MNIYRFTLSIDDQIMAKDEEEAWRIAKQRVEDRYYGPIQGNIELLEEIAKPAGELASES